MSARVLGEKAEIDLDVRTHPQSLGELTYNILKGNNTASLHTYPSTSFSDSTIQWNIQAPSIQSFLDRKALILMSAIVTVTRSGASDPSRIFGASTYVQPTNAADYANFFNGNFALRAVAPLHSACTKVEVSLNNNSISYDASQFVAALFGHYGPKMNSAETNIGSLYYPDQSWDYDDFPAPRNPLSTYGNCPFGSSARGSAFESLRVISNTANACSFEISWYEPVIIPPFIAFSETPDKQGLAGLNSVTLSYSIGKIERMFSLNLAGIQGGINDFAVDVTFRNVTTVPTLMLNWLSLSVADTQFLRANKYGFSKYSPWITGGNTLAPRQSTKIISLVTQTSSVPSKVFVYIQRAQHDRTIYTSDAFCRIDSIDMTFGNMTNLLGNSTNGTLYQMSSRNGIKVTQNQFSNYTGSVVCIDMQKDIPLGDLSVGFKGSFNIQVNVNVTNLSYSSVPVELIMLLFNESVLEISNGSTLVYEGLIDKETLDNAKIDPNFAIKPENIVGGAVDLGECTKMFARKAFDIGKPLLQKASQHVPVVGPYISDAIDLGTKAYDIYKSLRGSGMTHEQALKEAKAYEKGQYRPVGGAAIKNKNRLRKAIK